MELTKSKSTEYMAFITTAYAINQAESNYSGMHTVWSGFNEAFRMKFPGVDPVEVTKALVLQGEIRIRPIRGGSILYMGEDGKSESKGGQLLAKMGG